MAPGAVTAAALLLLLLLLRPPSPASHLRFSLPFLSLPFPPKAAVGTRRRWAPGDGTPTGSALARQGLSGPFPLPHPPCGLLNASSHWGACALLLDETLGACAEAAALFVVGCGGNGGSGEARRLCLTVCM